MKAKKSLGQHFLRSERALNKIIEAGQIQPGETILEIGPGQGVLTERLLASHAHVIAVEKDDELHHFLENKFEAEIKSEQLTLVHDDILNFEPTNYKLEAGRYKLVANIPYNITGAILEKFLSHKEQPKQIVLLVQDEVAKRIVARDGKESILSLSVKAYGEPRYVEKVLAGSFAPAPQVNSAIISIESVSTQFFQGKNGPIDEKVFFSLIKAGFRSKRKKLISNLAILIGKDKAQKAFQELSLDENLRAEDLPLSGWREIMHTLS